MDSTEKCADTQHRLLESACELFAQQGYRETTLAGICDRAGANRAAVNYYFRSKENLYAEAWRVAFERSFKAHPLDGGVPAEAAPEERLRGHILAMARRITDPDSAEFDIVQKERANPTGLLAEIMRKSIQPVRDHLADIVRELLGEGVAEQHVELCLRSVMALCLHVFLPERLKHRTMGPPPLNLGIDAIGEHVARFSLAGIRDMRKRIESGQEPRYEE